MAGWKRPQAICHSGVWLAGPEGSLPRRLSRHPVTEAARWDTQGRVCEPGCVHVRACVSAGARTEGRVSARMAWELGPHGVCRQGSQVCTTDGGVIEVKSRSFKAVFRVPLK